VINVVLFDLDGTLSDSAPGILSSLQASFADHGVPWVDDATARSLLGPPFSHSLPPLVGEDRLAGVVDSYRKYYVDGRALLDCRLYGGMAALLAELGGRGLRLAVATSKPEPHAIEVISHLGLASHFETIGGDTIDGARDSKALVVGEVLRRLGNPDPESVLMVGDRSHDVLGSAAHGISCAGVLWGYGTATELIEAGARTLCSVPADITALL
jgi:phosphoglycolate phosphatase